MTYQFKFDKGNIYQTPEVDRRGSAVHVWNYEKVHSIDKITAPIIQELKEGSISFQIYAYPPTNMTMPKDDGGAAIKKRMTMRAGATDAQLEAKVLGLKEQSDEVLVPSANNNLSKSGNKSNLRRKETLSKAGKLEQQQVVLIAADGKAVTETKPAESEKKDDKVQKVGKEGSACCTIF